MTGDLVNQQQSIVAQQLMAPDIFGRPRVSKATIRRLRMELDEALVSQFKVERAKQTAVSALLAEDQVRTLIDALHSDPSSRLQAEDYLKALHSVGVTQVMKAGN